MRDTLANHEINQALAKIAKPSKILIYNLSENSRCFEILIVSLSWLIPFQAYSLARSTPVPVISLIDNRILHQKTFRVFHRPSLCSNKQHNPVSHRDLVP